MTAANRSSFRQRLVDRDLLVGTWVKTPSPIVCEVLGKSDLDVLCLDAEHAPFGRLELDACISATRAVGVTTLVRVPSADPANILNALDCGATGVVVPHIKTVEDAEAMCHRSLYGPGGRGYSGSTRAAGFGGKAIADQLRESADGATIITQIEDINHALKDKLFELNHVRVNPNADNTLIIDSFSKSLEEVGVKVTNVPDSESASMYFKPLGEISETVRFHIGEKNHIIFLSPANRLKLVSDVNALPRDPKET